MRRFGWAVALLFAFAAAAGADDRDPVARARLLYNQGKWADAIMAADQARAALTRADSAELIAARINGAQLVKLPHASHIFTTDQPEASRKAVMDFLASQSF